MNEAVGTYPAVKADVPATRSRFLRSLWDVGLWPRVIAALWAMYGLLAFLRDEFISEQAQSQWRLVYVLHWALSVPVEWWVVGALCMLLLWVFEAGLRLHRMDLERLAELRAKVDAQPRLIAEITTIKELEFGGTGGIPVEFASVTVANVPVFPSENCEARRLSARLEFWTQNRGEKLFEIQGRWSDTLEQTGGGPSEEQEVTNLAAYHRKRLDVAIKVVANETIYALNEDSHKFHGWMHPAYEVTTERAAVRVVLAGGNVSPTAFWLELVSHGRFGGMELKSGANLSGTP